ncbi:M24 family metallopeptidase [Pseudomonas nicosulfuronedens]|nr:M24 family metallopeptidase [Pseudomonas nicosulfuronedens]MDH1012931.1 M24 family metallopeptidase [Pseudomonas nicosulfuronedens]MDH1982195.1 M24 family metallopeptidase [Pseudomonas nicosulfuronedens]MDH2030692.1 M24 family metallopeptidase [Pseudomonas nicosulfuronedens]
MSSRLIAVLFACAAALACQESFASTSLMDQFFLGNGQLALKIAGTASDKRLADQREQAPEISVLLQSISPLIARGESGLAIQRHVLKRFHELGWQPMMVGYNGYPAAIAISMNDGVLNGFPTSQPIPQNTLVKVELVAGTPYSHLAQTWTFAGKNATQKQKMMLEAARLALREGVEQVHAGAELDGIGEAISKTLNASHIYPVREYCGYAMGAARIEPPQILGYRPAHPSNLLMHAGQVLNVYVLAQTGEYNTRVSLSNGLEAFTSDGGDSVVLSVMVEVTSDGYRLLTRFVD